MIPLYPEIRLNSSNVDDTLDAMKRIMDETGTAQRIRNLAVRIVSRVQPRDRVGEAQAIQDWINREIDYRWDPIGTEWIQYPEVTLRERAGDCDDMAILAGALLQSLGHWCEPVAVLWKGHKDYSHAVLHDDMAKIIVDPVAGIQVASWPPHPYQVQALRRPGESMRIETFPVMHQGARREELGDLGFSIGGWDPLKAARSVTDKLATATQKLTNALPITQKAKDFINKTAIQPGKIITNAQSTAFLGPSSVMISVGDKVTTMTMPKAMADKLQALLDKGQSAQTGLLNKAVDKSIDDLSAWMIKHPKIVAIVGSIVVACVCAWAFGAWGSIIAKTSMKMATTPPDAIPTGTGANLPAYGLDVVGPETSQMLSAWALQNDVPTIELPLQGTGQTIIVPASEQGMCDGTKAALNWTAQAVQAGGITTAEALQILDLLRQLMEELPEVSQQVFLENGLYYYYDPAGTKQQIILAPRVTEVLDLIDTQAQLYRANVVPSQVAIASQSGISPLLILAGGGLLAYLLLRGEK